MKILITRSSQCGDAEFDEADAVVRLVEDGETCHVAKFRWGPFRPAVPLPTSQALYWIVHVLANQERARRDKLLRAETFRRDAFDKENG